MILRIKLLVLFLGLISIFVGAWGLFSKSLTPGQGAVFMFGGFGGLIVFTLCLPLLRLRLFRSLERTLAGALEESSPSPQAYFNKLGLVPPQGKLGRFRLRRLGALRMLERPAFLDYYSLWIKVRNPSQDTGTILVQDCILWIEASCPVDLRIARAPPMITRQLLDLTGVSYIKTGTRLDDVYLIRSRDPEGARAFLRPEMQSVFDEVESKIKRHLSEGARAELLFFRDGVGAWILGPTADFFDPEKIRAVFAALRPLAELSGAVSQSLGPRCSISS